MVPGNKAIFAIGTAAKMLKVHPRTLRIYEIEGLVKPQRQGRWRHYSLDDIRWVECLRKMIHQQKISIPAIKKLLQYTQCWNIRECSLDQRKQCTAFNANAMAPGKTEDIPGSIRHAGSQGAA